MSKPYMTEIEVLILYVGRSEDEDYEIELRWYDGDSKYGVYNYDGKYLGTWRPEKDDDIESIEDSDLLELLDTYAPHKASA
jgi:hypothetical protein